MIVLGTIVRPHGLKGEVKLSLSCSGLERLTSCSSLRLVKDGKTLKQVSIIRAFMHGDGDAIVRLKEVGGVEEAEALRGAQLAVPLSERAALQPGAYYISDLLGMAVVTTDGKELGFVEEVMDGLANGVCVVRKGNQETLVPMLKAVIRMVDVQARKMVVELPEEIDADTAN